MPAPRLEIAWRPAATSGTATADPVPALTPPGQRPAELRFMVSRIAIAFSSSASGIMPFAW